jgi:GAF domain-containing protein
MALGPQDESALSARLGLLARDWAMRPELADQLRAVADQARTIPYCDAVGITVVVEGRSRTMAATDRLTLEVDLIQYETGEGPCLEAIERGDVVRFDLAAADQARFPHFAPGAIDVQIRSVLSLPLVAGGLTVGALNLYSHTDDAFTIEAEVELGKLIADQAATIVYRSRFRATAQELADNVASITAQRALLARAQGVLAGRLDVSLEEAFDRLRRSSSLLDVPMDAVIDVVLRVRDPER